MKNIVLKSLFSGLLLITSLASFANTNYEQAIVGSWDTIISLNIPEGKMQPNERFDQDHQTVASIKLNGMEIYNAYGSWKIVGNKLCKTYYSEYSMFLEAYGTMDLYVEECDVIQSIDNNHLVLADPEDGEVDAYVRAK